MIFTLPIPPSANNLFLNVKGRGRVVAPVYMQWKADAAELITLHRGRPLSKPYGIHIRANVNHRRDIDNIAKPLLDALVAARIITGDQWVNRLIIDRDQSADRCQVEVWSIADEGEARPIGEIIMPIMAEIEAKVVAG